MCILNHVPGVYEEHSIDRGGGEHCQTGRYASLAMIWVGELMCRSEWGEEQGDRK